MSRPLPKPATEAGRELLRIIVESDITCEMLDLERGWPKATTSAYISGRRSPGLRRALEIEDELGIEPILWAWKIDNQGGSK